MCGGRGNPGTAHDGQGEQGKTFPSLETKISDAVSLLRPLSFSKQRWHPVAPVPSVLCPRGICVQFKARDISRRCLGEEKKEERQKGDMHTFKMQRELERKKRERVRERAITLIKQLPHCMAVSGSL